MKKSVRTLMTAAMFAAALGTAAANASAAQAGGGLLSSMLTATAGEIVTTYGPPQLRTSETETETTAVQTAPEAEEPALPDASTTSEPPRFSGGVMIRQNPDVNGDLSVDARDISEMKRSLLNGAPNTIVDSALDFNHDGVFDKKDIITQIMELTGMPEWKPEDPAVTTTAAETAFPATETTILSEILPQPAYGPIGWYDSE